ncbi:MAG: MBL fold metallo-hydrolase [Actinomycetota bacterium]
MIFKQFRYEPLGQASYLLGCIRSKQGVVVDPTQDLGVEHYLSEAADLGLTIKAVFDTHVHADYVSCGRELAESAGVPYYMHESLKGLARFDFQPIKDGEVFEFGRVRLEVLHTPGHTPEHCCYVVTDGARADDPWLVLTGDCLMVGDVGRPDLLLEDQALNVMNEEQRAESQYRSITEKLFALPDHVEVWPAHYGGSTCGGINMSGKPSSTIYYEKNFNLAIRQPDAMAFASFMKESARPFPANYKRIKAHNLGLLEPDDVDEGSVEEMDAGSFAAAIDAGNIAVDLRPALVFARGHIPGAINLQYNTADLADRAEMVLPPGSELVLYADTDAVAKSAAALLTEAGFQVGGVLKGGADAWTTAGRETANMPVISAEELFEGRDGYEVIDVRESFEFKYGHIPGATLLPSMEAWERVDEVPKDTRLAIVCGDQVRSGLVASILQRAGRQTHLVSGGMTDWLERGYPMEKVEKTQNVG